MNRPLSLLLLLSALFAAVCAPLAAQDAAPALARNLGELLDRYCEANGGRERINNVRSLRVEATLTLPSGASGKMVFIKQSPNFVRSVWYGPRNLVVRKGYNGVEAWEHVSEPGGRDRYGYVDKPPLDVFEWVLANPQASGAVLEMLPVERDGRSECYRVRASYASGMVKDYWLDTASYRELRVEERQPGKPPVCHVIEEHQKFDGIWFPLFQRELLPDGSYGQQLRIDDVQMNIGLVHCFFDPPQEMLRSIQREKAADEAEKTR